MSLRKRPVKKRALFWILPVLVIAGGFCAFSYWSHSAKPLELFHINSEDVETITISDGRNNIQADITDRDRIGEIAALLNQFDYVSSAPAASGTTGWNYMLWIQNKSSADGGRRSGYQFEPDKVRVGDAWYSDGTDCFQRLIDLMEPSYR